ncbi:MAG: hypothetical protein OEY63_00490 [Gemmatimonadota bacterium]|nr:hypothetical protein [Gemmatimonadota bacterium]MDH5805041.1 hypothetical protein [Gemmatimonadota bacterium]
MKPNNVTHVTPESEDPLVHKWLSELPQLEPGSGFEDAVMAHITIPKPSRLKKLQSATSGWLTGRRRRLALAATVTYATLSTTSVVLLTTVFGAQTSAAWSALVAQPTSAIWESGIVFLLSAVHSMAPIAVIWNIGFTEVALAASAGVVVSILCALGLKHMLRYSNGSNALDYANA